MRLPLRIVSILSAGLLVAGAFALVGALPAAAVTYTPEAGLPAAPTNPNEVVSSSGNIDSTCGAGLTSYAGTVYTTIGAAVAAATAGQTIYVCAGTYDETVDITTDNVTLDGAQWSVAAPGRSAPGSIIAPAVNADAVDYSGAITTGAVNGFTLEGAPGATSLVSGIATYAVPGAGYTFENNVIEDFTVGLYLQATGAGDVSTTISGNSFENNTNDPSNGAAGQGIFDGGAGVTTNNVTVENNSFSGDFVPTATNPNADDCDINTTGNSAGGIQTGWVIKDNTSTGAGNFLVLFETTGAIVEDNTVTGNLEAAFYIGGDNTGTQIEDNTVSDGNGSSSEGFQLTNYPGFGYGDSTDLTIEGNTISGQDIGIEGDNSYPGSTIYDNTITGSTDDGILMTSGATGYTITGNHVSGSGTYDYEDDNTGSGETLNTGNIYDGNTGATASPAGLLTVPGAPTIGTATAGDAQATVTFSPPASTGSDPINGYTVTATDTTAAANGGQSATGTASPITVTGLTNGDSYTFTVTATSSVGTGAASAASNAVVPSPTTTVPGAPTIGTATAGNAQATVSFTAPASTGGATITSYTVKATDGTTAANGGQSATGTASPITVTGLTNGDSYTFTVTATNGVGTGAASAASNAVVPAATAPGRGYDLVGSDGGVFVFNPPGATPQGFYGSLPGIGVHVNNIVGIVPTADDGGYYLVGSDGGVFAFGNAPFLGSLPGEGVQVNDIVGIIPTANDQGYFLVGRDGGVFAFGNAPFLGSLPGEHISVNNVVGIAATSNGQGYWVVTSGGQVYSFGNASNLGSVNAPVTGIATTPNGAGYWLIGPDGGVFTFGNAGYYGSLPGIGVHVKNIVGIIPSIDGMGYQLIGSDGGVFAFGDTQFDGSLPGIDVTVHNIVGAVPTATIG